MEVGGRLLSKLPRSTFVELSPEPSCLLNPNWIELTVDQPFVPSLDQLCNVKASSAGFQPSKSMTRK